MRLVRLLLASLLSCATLAGAAPVGLVADAGHCSMPCCQGAGGDCADGSCSVEQLSNPTPPLPASASEESDPMCGAPDAKAHAGHETPDAGRAAPQHAHGATHHEGGATRAAPAHHAEPVETVTVEVRIEHNHRRHVSAGNTSPLTASVAPAVSRPCPPDCGATANAFTNLRRTRDQAALAPKLRPRPPPRATRAWASAGLSNPSSTRRGPCSPRAPPRTFLV